MRFRPFQSASDSLAALGENGLLRLLTGRWKTGRGRVLTGVGDDCAVLRGEQKDHFFLLKTDAVVEGVHFTPRERPELIGRKALARALSDLAAMGASPLAALITLGAPAGESVRRLRAIYRGIERVAKKYRVELAGGETTRARQLFLSVALLGECRGHRPVLRSGARAGNLIFVTGRLGATRARRHLLFEPRLAEGRWLARHRFASALMDLSDGLGADLPRLARASGVSFRLDPEAIPRARGATLKAAFDDGEDYELLFTTRPSLAKSLKKKWPFATPLHCIGVMAPRGKELREPLLSHGFDHFKQR
ncbi:MAG TPA: thiamine-phosphate kinase [Candidatus Methylacidiphilales bacterium]|jgi:thiamine-monophosphate kinase|nr:thiamine-phosphate kinase [Candidatus Methylacidiphilales bacterium]